MSLSPAVSPDKFTAFGDLLKYLRRRAGLTQRELSIAVGYSDTQISRLEQNQRVPDTATLTALFVPALHLEHEPAWATRLLDLAAAARAEGEPEERGSEIRTPPHNLPLQLTSFIGREKEIAEVKRLLRGPDRTGLQDPSGLVRLLTLTGAGGVGKTRLALQVASDLLQSFPDGVWLIELAPLSDPALVPQTVAVVLGVKEEPGRPLQATLTDHLRGKQALLILDNCEHLVQASAQLAEAVLRTCPDVRLLATSREMLGVAGERALYVPSFSLPDPHTFPPVGADPVSAPVSALMSALSVLTQSEAIRLFVDRAASVMPGFSLTPDNAPAIVQICQRLDGIPLAIELAAVRVKVLRVEQIAVRLADAFRLLTGGVRTALPRQQTLQATMDWSYDLLSEAERRLFNRLSVFAGGWTLEAAEAVCADVVGADPRVGPGAGADTQISPDDILEQLTQLVNKSLVLAEREQGEETRYRLLEIIRQYALVKLAVSGEADAVRRQHAEYFLALAESGMSSNPAFGPLQPAWLDRMEKEHDNVRTALTWSQSVTDSAELGLSLIHI